MVGMINRLLEGLEVPLRAFYWKARGAVAVACDMPTGRMKKENVRWVLAVIKAKAVAVASAWLSCLFVDVLA